MHIVSDRPTFQDTNVRGDEGAAQAVRHQVAVMHAGTADAPGICTRAPAEHQTLGRWRHPHRWIGCHKMHPQTVGRCEQRRPGCGRVFAQQINVGGA